MGRTLTARCPGCASILVIDRLSGELLEHRAPIAAESSGDRLKDALEREKGKKARRETALDKIDSKIAREKIESEKIFRRSLEKSARDQGEKPDNIFDFE